jgi:hypothetical protein
MSLALRLRSRASGESMLLRLTTVASASAKLRFARLTASELVLSSAWQLALALGGRPFIDSPEPERFRLKR